ncbi:MAG: hypothetical protein V7739_06120 [Motiliproteus sp.]
MPKNANTSAAHSRNAFALGGLGGFNAHGVGFLQASLDSNVEPEIISCTSGQIYWSWRYLLQKNNEADPFSGEAVDMRTELDQEIAKSNIFPEPLQWLDASAMAMRGDPGIFSPAIEPFWKNLLSPYMPQSFDNLWKQFGDEILNRLMPAQIFVSERSPESLTEIGRRFAAESKIGIVFNAFDAPKGQEILYINKRAQELLKTHKPDKYQHDQIHNDVRIQVLDPENPQQLLEAVDGALWLYLYGFQGRNGKERTILDGAYHRQFVIRELAPAADRIFSVRPQSLEWNAKMPRNRLQVSNLETQLWFNASYSGEVAHIELINELLKKGHLPSQYRPIDLKPVEYETHIRFFDYFVERKNVYQDAYDHSTKLFKSIKE